MCEDWDHDQCRQTEFDGNIWKNLQTMQMSKFWGSILTMVMLWMFALKLLNMFWSKKSRRVNSNWWSIFECEDKYARKGVVGWSMRRVRGRAVAGGCSDTGAATHTASQLYVNICTRRGCISTLYTIHSVHYTDTCASPHHTMQCIFTLKHCCTLLHNFHFAELCRILQFEQRYN